MTAVLGYKHYGRVLIAYCAVQIWESGKPSWIAPAVMVFIPIVYTDSAGKRRVVRCYRERFVMRPGFTTFPVRGFDLLDLYDRQAIAGLLQVVADLQL